MHIEKEYYRGPNQYYKRGEGIVLVPYYFVS